MNEYELYVDLERVYNDISLNDIPHALELLGKILSDMEYERTL